MVWVIERRQQYEHNDLSHDDDDDDGDDGDDDDDDTSTDVMAKIEYHNITNKGAIKLFEYTAKVVQLQ